MDNARVASKRKEDTPREAPPPWPRRPAPASSSNDDNDDDGADEGFEMDDSDEEPADPDDEDDEKADGSWSRGQWGACRADQNDDKKSADPDSDNDEDEQSEDHACEMPSERRHHTQQTPRRRPRLTVVSESLTPLRRTGCGLDVSHDEEPVFSPSKRRRRR